MSKQRWVCPSLYLHLYQPLSLLFTEWMASDVPLISALLELTGTALPPFSITQDRSWGPCCPDVMSTGQLRLTDVPGAAFTTWRALHSERFTWHMTYSQKSESKTNEVNPTFYFQRYVYDKNSIPALPDFTAIQSLIRFLHFCQKKWHPSTSISLPFYTLGILDLGCFRPGKDDLHLADICFMLNPFDSVAALHPSRVKTRKSYIISLRSNHWWDVFRMKIDEV